MTKPLNQTTDFGFESVPREEKSKRVRQVFDSVAKRYDVMNDVMSFGLHRIWKRLAISLCQLRSDDRVLDLACGTGDLARLIHGRLGVNGELFMCDINRFMLDKARDRSIDRGVGRQAYYIQADAEKLPFLDNYFNVITLGFGLRNVTEKANALRSMYHCLKPGGRLLVLEFSKPLTPSLQTLYDQYSFKVLPKLGKWIANDEASYRYLVQSIRMHPDQQDLKQMMLDSGYENVQVYNLTGGIVAIHRGYKF